MDYFVTAKLFRRTFWNDVLIWCETLKTVKVLQGMKVKTRNHEAIPNFCRFGAANGQQRAVKLSA